MERMKNNEFFKVGQNILINVRYVKEIRIYKGEYVILTETGIIRTKEKPVIVQHIPDVKEPDEIQAEIQAEREIERKC